MIRYFFLTILIVLVNVLSSGATGNFVKDTCINIVGKLQNNLESICEGQQISLIYDNTQERRNSNDSLIFVIASDPDPDAAAEGNFIKILSSMKFDFDLSYLSFNTTYYIFALLGNRNGAGSLDFNSPCVQVDGPKPFICYKSPEPYAGGDSAVCGSFYELNGVQSVPESKIKWRLIDGGGVSIADVESFVTRVSTNGQYGNYLFELVEDNHGCIAADQVSIKFNPLPFLAVDQRICIDVQPPFPYQAILTISDGLPPYYIKTGKGLIKGNKYVTDTIPSLSDFKVEVEDANGCLSNLVVDTYNCNCGLNIDSSAGKDFKKLGLTAKLNGTFRERRYWKQISGPGNVVFENPLDPSSKLKVDKYGRYCLLWSSITDPCERDTVCIQFYNIKTSDPDYPKYGLLDRNNYSNSENNTPIEFYVPGLITGSGSTAIVCKTSTEVLFNYQWVDLNGTSIYSNYVVAEIGVSEQTIYSPVQPGFYILAFKTNGSTFVRKIAVLN
jgi:hypothetical protein